jgi:hypothetical protein
MSPKGRSDIDLFSTRGRSDHRRCFLANRLRTGVLEPDCWILPQPASRLSMVGILGSGAGRHRALPRFGVIHGSLTRLSQTATDKRSAAFFVYLWWQGTHEYRANERATSSCSRVRIH